MKIAIYRLSDGFITSRPDIPIAEIDLQIQVGEEFYLNCNNRATHIINGVPTIIQHIETLAELSNKILHGLEQFYDLIAQSKHYDNRLTCAIRAGYPGPFQAEGIAFGTWMDTCNAHAYQALVEIQAGLRTIPTIEEAIAELPQIVWP